MTKSILQDDYTTCFLCGANGSVDPLEEHHVFGAANRKHSERYGLKVKLCGDRCHRNGKRSVHRNADVADKLKEIGQKAWIITYGSPDDFMDIFGRNYI
jgi:hypothetical protein